MFPDDENDDLNPLPPLGELGDAAIDGLEPVSEPLAPPPMDDLTPEPEEPKALETGLAGEAWPKPDKHALTPGTWIDDPERLTMRDFSPGKQRRLQFLGHFEELAENHEERHGRPATPDELNGFADVAKAAAIRSLPFTDDERAIIDGSGGDAADAAGGGGGDETLMGGTGVDMMTTGDNDSAGAVAGEQLAESAVSLADASNDGSEADVSSDLPADTRKLPPSTMGKNAEELGSVIPRLSREDILRALHNRQRHDSMMENRHWGQFYAA